MSVLISAFVVEDYLASYDHLTPHGCFHGGAEVQSGQGARGSIAAPTCGFICLLRGPRRSLGRVDFWLVGYMW